MKFHRPLRGKKSSPFPTFNFKIRKFIRKLTKLSGQVDRTTGQLQFQKPNASNTLGAGRTRPSTGTKFELIAIPHERNIGTESYLFFLNDCIDHNDSVLRVNKNKIQMLREKDKTYLRQDSHPFLWLLP